MNKISSTYPLLAFFLAILVFLTSSGFVLGKHHCKMKAANASFSCAEMGCQKGCCSTEFQYFKLDQDQQISNLDMNQLKTPEVFAAILTIFQIDFPSKNTLSSKFQTYKPPIVESDISVLFQVFRL